MIPRTLRRATLRRVVAAPALLGALFGALVGLPPGAASAQSVPVPIRHDGFTFVSPDSPSVLDATVGGPVAPADRPDLAQPAVPVAQVMNGGGFGYTGFDYYNDETTEGRFGAHKRPRVSVVAPAYLVPPR